MKLWVIVDDNGELIEKFSEDQVFDPNYDYLVSLVSFEGASMFPNIMTGKNNVFVYKTSATGAEQILNYLQVLIIFQTLMIQYKQDLAMITLQLK